jgi:hypothetical protein
MKPKFLQVAILALLIAITSFVGLDNVQAGGKGNQIMFFAKGISFKYLIIEGTNQNGDKATWKWDEAWRKNWRDGLPVITTQGWWWKDSVTLTFYLTGIGERSCRIDSLKTSSQYASTPVFYYLSGNYCTGDEGSVVVLDHHRAMIKYYLENEDGDNVFDATDQAYNRLACVEALANGLGGKPNYFRVGKECLGSVNDRIKGILKSYGKNVQFP